MTATTARRNAVEIAYETFGPASGEPLLLVMGTGGQMLAWHPDFCGALVDRGFQVTGVAGRDDRPDHGDQAPGPGADPDLPVLRVGPTDRPAPAAHPAGGRQGGQKADHRRRIPRPANDRSPAVHGLTGLSPPTRHGFASSVSSAMNVGTTSVRYSVRPRPSSPPVIDADNCPACVSRPWSSTAKRIRWSARSLVGRLRTPSRAPPSSPFPAWATIYRASCGRPSSTTFTA